MYIMPSDKAEGGAHYDHKRSNVMAFILDAVVNTVFEYRRQR